MDFVSDPEPEPTEEEKLEQAKAFFDSLKITQEAKAKAAGQQK